LKKKRFATEGSFVKKFNNRKVCSIGFSLCALWFPFVLQAELIKNPLRQNKKAYACLSLYQPLSAGGLHRLSFSIEADSRS